MFNPYSKFVELMRHEGASYNPPTALVAEVVSITPLTVKVGDVQLSSHNLLVSEQLLQHSRQAKFEGRAHINHSSTSSHLRSDGEYVHESVLHRGDNVLLIPTAGRQIFVVLAKVVRV